MKFHSQLNFFYLKFGFLIAVSQTRFEKVHTGNNIKSVTQRVNQARGETLTV